MSLDKAKKIVMANITHGISFDGSKRYEMQEDAIAEFYSKTTVSGNKEYYLNFETFLQEERLKTAIKVVNDDIYMAIIGKSLTNHYFQEQVANLSEYFYGGYSVYLNNYPKFLEIDLSENGGIIEIHYHLSDKRQILSVHSLELLIS